MKQNNLEKKLHKLPKGRLSLTNQLTFYLKLINKIINKHMNITKTKLTISLALSAIVLLLGLSTYAYTSISVTYGHPLFALKTTVESIETTLAKTAIEQVNVHLKIANRRMAEAKYLALVGEFKEVTGLSFVQVVHAQESDSTSDLNITQNIEYAVEETDTAIEIAEEITNPEELDEALETIEITQESQLEDLLDIAEAVGTEIEEVTDAVTEAVSTLEESSAEVAIAQEEVTEALLTDSPEIKIDIKTRKERLAQLTPEEVEELKNNLQSKTDELINNVLDQVEDPQEAQKIIDRIKQKQSQIDEAMANGNYRKAYGLIKATVAISNNAKRFIKLSPEEKKLKKEEIKQLKEKRKEEIKELKEKRKEEIKELKEKFKQATQEEKEKIKDELKKQREKLKDELKNKKLEIKLELEEKQEEIKDELEGKREEVKDELEEKREDVKDKLEENLDATESSGNL